MNNIAGRIKSELIARGKSQKELAEFIGIHEASLSRMLKSDKLNSDIMTKITQFLSVDLNFFNRDTVVKSSTRQSEPQAVNDDVNLLKEIIAAKDEVIRSKDELIATLKEKLKAP